MTWKPILKKNMRRQSYELFVSLRATGFGISVGLLEKAEAKNVPRVSLLVDEKRRRIGFRFHSKINSDSFALIREKSGRLVSARAVYRRFPWLRTAIGQRLSAQYDKQAKLWFVRTPSARAK